MKKPRTAKPFWRRRIPPKNRDITRLSPPSLDKSQRFETEADASAESLRSEEVLKNAATPEEKVRALIVGIMRSYEKHYPYLYAYVEEDMARIAGDKTPWGKEMKLFSEWFVVATVGIIQQGIDDGSFRLKSLSAQMTAFAVIGMCNWSHRWFRPSGRISLDMVGQSFAELALKGIIAGS